MNSNPKVSIIIPVYNGSDYLSEAIDSALAQTYSNIEILVINDGSTDGGKTEEVAKSYGDKIKYFQKENGGVATALNFGIKKMTGDYFSWLSHDDVYYPDKIEYQVNFIKSLKKTPVILFSDLDVIDSNSRLIRSTKINKYQTNNLLYALFTSYPLNGCTMLIPKMVFDQVGLFDEGLRTTQDYEMWFRMLRDYEFIHTPKALIKSRVHPQQGSKIINNSEERNQLYINALKDFKGVRIFKEKSCFEGYLDLSLALRKMGAKAASSFAKDLALENQRGLHSSKVFRGLLYYRVLLLVFSPLIYIRSKVEPTGFGDILRKLKNSVTRLTIRNQ